MKKQQVLDRLDAAWNEFLVSWSGLDDAKLEEPGAMGDWTVKDILAHVSWWEEEALKYLPLALREEKPPRYKDMYGGIDAFNALMHKQKQGLSLEETRKALNETHNRLLDYLTGIPDEQYTRETRFRRRLKLDTYQHYPEHTRVIQEWRKGKG